MRSAHLLHRSGARATGLIIALTLFAAACGGADAPEDATATPVEAVPAEGPAQGGRIVVGLPVEPATLDSAKGSIGEINVAESLYANLVKRDPKTGGILPELAERWEESEDSLQWTFYLKEGQTFTNGEPVDCEAVRFSINRFVDPSFGATSFRGYWTMVDTIECPSDLVVVFNLKSPRSVLAQAVPWHTVLVPPAYLREVGNNVYGQFPIGNGPFILKEWVRGRSMIFVANDDYVLGRPYLDEIEFRFFPDEAARAAAILSGEVDVAGPISIEQVDFITAAPGVSAVSAPFSIRRDRLILRADKPPFNDVRMRLAVAHAIDKDAIVDGILGDYGKTTAGPIVEGEYGWTPQLEDLATPYDPIRARELVVEAGYGDGVNITFDIRPGTFPKDDETPEAIVRYLAEVGINATIVSQPQGTFIGKVRDGGLGEMGMALMVGGGNFHAFHSFEVFFHCTNSSTIWHPRGPDGQGLYNCYPEMDELATEALRLMSSDVPASLAKYEEAQRYAIDNTVSTFLWSYIDPFGVNDRVFWEPSVQGDWRFEDAYLRR